jgi:uncharacterized membrane protein
VLAIMHVPIVLSISILINQEVMMLGCQLSPCQALALSGTAIITANVVMQALMRHWEIKDRASFLLMCDLQS